MSNYENSIQKILNEKNLNFDPRHIEGFMRLEYSTLDGLSKKHFEQEVIFCALCVRNAGPKKSETNALSFGL